MHHLAQRYYSMYVALRQQYKLISHPYYGKYAKPGDQTFFRHIDLNIADAVYSGLGVEMIQGTVSWDYEDDDNCTEMLDGFHRYLEEYAEWRKAQGLTSTGCIEKWEPSDFPPEWKVTKPHVEWKKYALTPGVVRISDPRIPHGSTGPATKIRRTSLPWYVRVQEDGITMENPKMGQLQGILRRTRWRPYMATFEHWKNNVVVYTFSKTKRSYRGLGAWRL